MKIAKEFFIIVLLLAVVIFTLGIMFYSSIPGNKATPEAVEYEQTAETAETIQAIQKTKTSSTESQLLGESSDSSSSSTDSKSNDIILASYTVGPGELNTAQNKNYYQSGKSNPFEDYKEPAKTDNPSDDSNSSSGGNGSSSGTGKLFENTKSK